MTAMRTANLALPVAARRSAKALRRGLWRLDVSQIGAALVNMATRKRPRATPAKKTKP